MSVTAPKGVSISFLEFFLSKKLKTKTWTTSEVLTHVVAPETKQKKCAYYTLYEKTKDSKGSLLPYVANANVFVSHAWSYKCEDLIKTCLAYAKESKEPKKVYFWIDLFINNQNTATTKEQSWWSQKFRKTIGDVGNTLLVLSPWNNPVPITRAWCLWEILCTVQENAKLEVGLPSDQQTLFNSAIKKEYNQLFHYFLNGC